MARNSLTFQEYQTLSYMAAKRYTSNAWELVDHALGLAVIVGKIADSAREYTFEQYTDTKDMQDKIAEALWYLSALCTAFGVNLDEIAEANLTKLVPRGKKES